MNLHDATSHCKTMLTQANGNTFTVTTHEEDVIESSGYSSYSSSTRSFSKFEVWLGPYGEQQIYAILVVDTSGSSLAAAMWGGSLSLTPTAKPDEIGLVFMDKTGNCRAVLAKAVDSTWKKVDPPDMFWSNQWAKAIHDIAHGISRTKPDMMQDKYGSYKLNDQIQITQKGSSNGAVGKILSFFSYKNNYGFYGDPMVLIGDVNVKGAVHVVSVNEISLHSGINNSIDKKQEKVDTEFERMMRFFASSQHDPSSPWYRGPGKERK